VKQKCVRNKAEELGKFFVNE